MVLATAAAETEELVQSYMFASRYIDNPLPRFRLPESSIPKDAAYQIIQDEILLDWNPKMNLSTFVTTWMEPECDKLMMSAINKNYLDLDGCPVTKELQNRCVNMLARLFHAPLVDDEQAAGVATVGSSEAIMLAGLAYKRRWQNKRKTEKKPYDEPNIVIGSNMQVCWRKFATYFEVELKEIPLEMGMYTMNPDKVKEMVDENTICVCTVLGSTYNGEYEDVEAINDILTEINQERGLDIPIHVDAASGGFVAPFLDPDYKWDFRLPQVRSINVSGHKYGLVYAGVGWMIWRSKRDIPEELIFNIECTGPGEPTYSLNFSRGSSQLIGQYYQLIRLGFEGYKKIMDKCRTNAKYLTVLLEKSGRFNIISCPMFGVPLVAFSLKDSSEYDEHDVSDFLCMFGWIVPVYTMPPNVGDIQILRVVVREDFSRTLAERLAQDIEHACKELGYDFYSCADQEGEEGSHQEVDEEEAGGHDEAADGQGHESTTEVDGEGGETGESGGHESDESGDYEENQPTNAPC